MFRNTLHPKEDAYISQYYANSNFGAEPYLYTNRYQGPGDEYQSLLKFNGEFQFRDFNHHHNFCHPVRRFRSKLRLRIYRNEIPSTATLLVYKVIGDWSELNVTWNNRPAIDPTPIGSKVIHAGYFGWVEIDLDYVDYTWDQGLLLKCDEPFNSLIGFYSREYSDSSYWPQLQVAGAIVDEAEKPVITVTPMAAAVTLSPDLIRVPPYRDLRRRRLPGRFDRADRIRDGVRRFDRADRICDGVRRFDRADRIGDRGRTTDRTNRIGDRIARRFR